MASPLTIFEPSNQSSWSTWSTWLVLSTGLYVLAWANLALNAWLDWRTSFLSTQLNLMAAFSFGLGATLEFIINEPDVNILLASIVGWPLISLGLYYALYRAKLFYFGDVQYAAVLGLVCLARAGPLEYLFAQMVSLSAVLVALGIQYLTAKRLQITCPDRQLLPSNDFIPVNALVGSVEIRAGPYLLLGHSVAALMVIG